MAVRRIVANLAAEDPSAAAAFYEGVLGLSRVMDMGFIVTLAAPDGAQPPQLSCARDGGAGWPLPHLSIEVDDLDAVLARARAAGAEITHGPRREDWGVRRLYLRDPGGRLVNVLQHDPG
jgi:lactoylglutathione lyase